MGIPGATLDDIKTICSHAQGITQRAKWRLENLPDAVTKEMASTAVAASYVAELGDKSIAAIAAPGAAGLYGLSVLAENVQITDTNKTRFYVLSAKEMKDGEHTHAVFIASCKTSQIDDIILKMHEESLELVSIHDRPAGTVLGSYNYIIEIVNERGISYKSIEKISSYDGIRFLGSFEMIEK